MITIEQIRNYYPGYPGDTATTIHLLKEYVELLSLDFLSKSKFVSKISFIGGTNLRLIKGIDRFSEDLDFDCKALGQDEFKEMTDKVIRYLKLNGLPAESKEAESDRLTAMRRTIVFPELLYSLGLVPRSERDRKFVLKIEAQDQGYDYNSELKLISLNGFHFMIPAPPDSILCSMKLSTALNRSKGRDFYDSMFLLGMTSPDFGFLREKNGITDAAELCERFSSRLKEIDINIKVRDFEYLIFDKSSAKRILSFEDYLKTKVSNFKIDQEFIALGKTIPAFTREEIESDPKLASLLEE